MGVSVSHSDCPLHLICTNFYQVCYYQVLEWRRQNLKTHLKHPSLKFNSAIQMNSLGLYSSGQNFKNITWVKSKLITERQNSYDNICIKYWKRQCIVNELKLYYLTGKLQIKVLIIVFWKEGCDLRWTGQQASTVQ